MKIIHAIIISASVCSVLIVLALPLGEVEFGRYTVCESRDCENGRCAIQICNNGTKFGSISYLYGCNGVVYDTMAGYSWGQCVFNEDIQKIK